MSANIFPRWIDDFTDNVVCAASRNRRQRQRLSVFDARLGPRVEAGDQSGMANALVVGYKAVMIRRRRNRGRGVAPVMGVYLLRKEARPLFTQQSVRCGLRDWDGEMYRAVRELVNPISRSSRALGLHKGGEGQDAEN